MTYVAWLPSIDRLGEQDKEEIFLSTFHIQDHKATQTQLQTSQPFSPHDLQPNSSCKARKKKGGVDGGGGGAEGGGGGGEEGEKSNSISQCMHTHAAGKNPNPFLLMFKSMHGLSTSQ